MKKIAAKKSAASGAIGRQNHLKSSRRAIFSIISFHEKTQIAVRAHYKCVLLHRMYVFSEYISF